MGATRLILASMLLLGAQAARAAPTGRGAATRELPRHAVVGSAVKAGPGVQLEFRQGAHEGAVARAVFIDSRYTASGFGQLRIATSGSFSDAEQMEAAGFLEGWLTAERINHHHHNLRHYFLHQLNATLDRPMQWVLEQERWVRRQAAARGAADPFWSAVGLLQSQFDGLWLGYSGAMDAAAGTAAGPAARLDRSGLVFLNSNGELYDLLDFFDSRGAAARLEAMGADELLAHLALQGKCSALIKVAADLSDVFFGHSTWDSYTAMTRIYKHYELELNQVPGGVAAQRLSFSSYPGEIFSDDDLYLTSAGLVVMETTNHIYSFDVLASLSPATVPSWMRVRAANLLAANGSAWVEAFRRHNSGTYNNQYMVSDLKRFRPGRELLDGLLWVVEQLPGAVEAADMTQVLARGYFASYNVPLSPRVRDASGYPRLARAARARGREYDQPARWLMYQSSPRAEIFRRDQGSVDSLAAMRRLMRYNGYQHDPLSSGHPLASVCARGDLAARGAIPKGCYDTKVTSFALASSMESEVVLGPTTQGGLPPFEWSGRWEGFAHEGMPERFDRFGFERMSAAALPLPGVDCGAVAQV